MARRKSTATQIVRAVPVRTPAPIIRVSAPRPAKEKKKHRRRRGGSSSGGGISHLAKHAAGGFAFGYIQKTFPNLPTLPIVGQAGSIALLAHYMRGKFPLASEIATAAAVIAGYQLGHDGKVQGEDEQGVFGVAAQL